MERIHLSNATFEGDNNAYLFADGPETALVDTGDWTPDTREQLEAGLRRHGVGFEDVDRIFLTHWHADHAGLAGDVQAESGATVHVHEADAALVAGDPDAWDALEAAMEACFEAWGMPESERATLRETLAEPETMEPTPEVRAFEDGATFSVNGRRLEAVHAPGHAGGLCLFETGEEVLAGDALLPTYTPNVGGADVRVEAALAKYLRTLDRIAAADYRRAWPGHREPIDDPSGRARDIVSHHEQRAWRILDALDRRGPADAWTVSADLFGSLDGIHILHGPGEADAHLQHLESEGGVLRSDGEWRLAEGVPDRLDRRDDQQWPLDR